MFKMVYIGNLLLYLLFLNMIGTCLLLITPSNKQKILKLIALSCSYLTYVGSLYLYIVSISSKAHKRTFFQGVISKIFSINILNLNITLGAEGLCLFFLILTTMLCALCFLVCKNNKNQNLKAYLLSFLIIEFFLILVFWVLEFLLSPESLITLLGPVI